MFQQVFYLRYLRYMHQQLRKLHERLQYLRNLEARKQEVINSIESQGKMTDEIRNSVQSAVTLAEVEDLYRPFKQKRRTRATMAKEKGLRSREVLFLD